jgi:uncharacterized membrane protein YphA (DoxX/SURF4 family)
MIQIFWFIDFLGLFLGRLILSIFLLREFFLKETKIFSYLYLILSVLIFLGFYSSFAFIFLIILETFQILRKIFILKENIFNLERYFLRIALAIVYLFVGPGSLSLDRIYNIRF